MGCHPLLLGRCNNGDISDQKKINKSEVQNLVCFTKLDLVSSLAIHCSFNAMLLSTALCFKQF